MMQRAPRRDFCPSKENRRGKEKKKTSINSRGTRTDCSLVRVRARARNSIQLISVRRDDKSRMIDGEKERERYFSSLVAIFVASRAQRVNPSRVAVSSNFGTSGNALAIYSEVGKKTAKVKHRPPFNPTDLRRWAREKIGSATRIYIYRAAAKDANVPRGAHVIARPSCLNRARNATHLMTQLLWRRLGGDRS